MFTVHSFHTEPCDEGCLQTNNATTSLFLIFAFISAVWTGIITCYKLHRYCTPEGKLIVVINTMNTHCQLIYSTHRSAWPCLEPIKSRSDSLGFLISMYSPCSFCCVSHSLHEHYSMSRGCKLQVLCVLILQRTLCMYEVLCTGFSHFDYKIEPGMMVVYIADCNLITLWLSLS